MGCRPPGRRRTRRDAAPAASRLPPSPPSSRATPLEVLDGVGDQLRGVPLLAVLVFPLAGLDAALDVDLGALAQVLRGELRLLAPGDDAEPLGLFLPLALLVLVVAVDGDRELGDRLTAGRVAHLRIAAQVADDHALVERHSTVLLALWAIDAAGAASLSDSSMNSVSRSTSSSSGGGPASSILVEVMRLA